MLGKLNRGFESHPLRHIYKCETRPACEEHYRHTLRKAAATNWLRSAFDLMKIKTWLGRTSLEVRQIYLDSEMQDREEQKKLDHAGKF